MHRYRKHRQWWTKAIPTSHCRVDQRQILLLNSLKMTSTCRVLAGSLAGGTEIAPNLTTDEALTQKLQDYKCFTSDKNPKAEDFPVSP